jgi:hypothetical protein
MLVIPPTAPYPSSGAATTAQIVTDVPSGLSLTAPQEAKKFFSQPVRLRHMDIFYYFYLFGILI